eukprot:SM000379S14411  [mRNA]  locus=s379:21663:24756:- [translate_table: standard]
MAGIHQEVSDAGKTPVPPKPARDDLELEEDDPVADYFNARRDAGLSLAAEAMQAGYNSDEEVYAAARAVDAGSVEYDSDDQAVVVLDKKRAIEPLPPLDHSLVDYEPFAKDLYEEHPEVAAMADAEVVQLMTELGIRVSGFDVPRPVRTFEQANFDPAVLDAFRKQGYKQPTPIQSQAWPVVLAGRDMIGIAKTGSGKTAGFAAPMVGHIMDQPELEKGEGPIAVICAPTRELAQQILGEVKKLTRAHSLRVAGIFGGMSKFEQFKELKAGCEVVIATPGRLIDMLKMKALTMRRTTYLVLDEADRMFDMGFEPQVRSIVGQIRPDRQTLLFSATMPARVERLARDILSMPVRVAVGEVGAANADIRQEVEVVPEDSSKLPWLLRHLPRFIDDGDVLVFASTKARVEDLLGSLLQGGFKAAALHGDKDQASRMEVLKQFKAGVHHVLVATDVAARGLDIKSIKTVVNYDMAKDMDSHVHRIGRTGRAGDKDGVAVTLLALKEARMAGELVTSLIAAGQDVPPELMDLAMKDGRFRAQREGRKGSSGRGGGAKGRGGRGGAKGGGRGVRGVNFGLGLGYSQDVKTPQSAPPPQSRGSAQDALKTGMMARFKSSFVAASPSAGSGMQGFVQGASMSNITPATTITSQARSSPASDASKSVDRSRERRRPSGWDR